MNKKNELISIIVPVYKAEAYLHECIDSILRQSYDNLEIILINDGSPDGSGRVCDTYAREHSRIKVIHKENGGVSSARNAGLEIAQGKYIAFVDSDDSLIGESMYERMCTRLEESDADICVCGFSKAYGNSVKESYKPDEKEMSFKQILEAIVEDPDKNIYAINFTVNKLYKRELIISKTNKEGPISFQTELRTSEDLRFNIDYLNKIDKGVAFIDFSPYKVNVTGNEDSLSKTGSAENTYDTYRYLMGVMVRILPSQKEKIEAIIDYLTVKTKFARFHYSVIYKRPYEGKLTFSMVKKILKYSSTKTYKLSSLLLFFLPRPLYRVAYKAYCRFTLTG